VTVLLQTWMIYILYVLPKADGTHVGNFYKLKSSVDLPLKWRPAF
jgi:hypothetical protein